MLLFFSSFSVIKEEGPDNDQERGNEEAEVVGGEIKILVYNTLLCVYFVVLILCVPLRHQEGSDHEEGEEADGEEEDFEMVGEETSDESDSEELEEKGKHTVLMYGLFSL